MALTASVGWLRGLGVAAFDLLLPPTCVVCDNVSDTPGLLCPSCFRGTGFITAPFCERCGVPFDAVPLGGANEQCPSCELAPPGFDRARAALRYDAGAKNLILPLKHADRVELVNTLAPMMARAGGSLLEDADVLVPVPLHQRRLFSRRYNQAALLARALGRIRSVAVLPDALRRTRATAALGSMSAAERHAELEGAFVVRRSRQVSLAGRRILLVDDVMTSGATASACARALKAAGAIAVAVLVAARVPDPRSRKYLRNALGAAK